jgi:signal transduction histidine kinase
LASLLALGPLCWAGRDAARAQEKPRRVLILNGFNPFLPLGVVTAGTAARKRMSERSREPLDFYSDFLDLGSFPGQVHEARTARYLSDKYRDRKPDVIMALGPSALRYIITYQADLGFDAPVVFCCSSRARLAALNPPGNVTGIISEFDLAKTMALAQRLQPEARHLVVFAGASEFDRQWEPIARRQLASHEQKYDTKYLVGLRYDDLLAELKRLPRDTIVILLSIFADGGGRLLMPDEVVQDITNAATAPVYSPYDTFLGRGIVGGHSDSFERIGDEIGDLALEILAGASPGSLIPRPTSGNTDRVDWRQLKRWNISESSLPPESDVRFRETGLWDQYRWQMVVILAAVLLQAALIAGLLFERRRRRLAEIEARHRVLEVAHLNRTATAGVMSVSIAHELNQPLGAILLNAETIDLLLQADSVDHKQIEEVVAEIRRDDQRATQIIKGLSGFLKKKSDVEIQKLDLNDALQGALHILEPEAVRKGVVLKTDPAPVALPVCADPVHLQQVILNLAINGMDAMQEVHGTRSIAFRTTRSGTSDAMVSVSDNGPGVPAEKLNSIFETFYTTKQHGSGLGLSIARTIVGIYGGKIWAENHPNGGAIFSFTLPLSDAAIGASS